MPTTRIIRTLIMKKKTAFGFIIFPGRLAAT